MTLFFSKLMTKETKNLTSDLLKVPEIKEYKRYLDLLVVVGRNKIFSLNYIKERVWNKLLGGRKNYYPKGARKSY